MDNNVSFFEPDLLHNKDLMKKIDYWKKVMNRSQGWHYDLDIIWILQIIEKMNLKKGATILDAGAGMGVTQFILASCGYNIVSLDFTPRKIPKYSNGIFNIKINNQDELSYKHEYMNFIKYKDGGISKNNRTQSVRKIFSNYDLAQRALAAKIRSLYSKTINLKEKFKDHSDFGSIEFVRAPFHKIPFENNKFDLLVSVSAIEHADKKLLGENINEFKRVVKKHSKLLITTSATSKGEDYFHKKSQGWCFSKDTLIDSFNVKWPNIDFIKIEKSFKKDQIWKNRLDLFYTMDSKSNFYKKRVSSIPYYPIGIEIEKN